MSDISNTPPEPADDLMKLTAEMLLNNIKYTWQINSKFLNMCAGFAGHLADVQQTALERHTYKTRYGQQ